MDETILQILDLESNGLVTLDSYSLQELVNLTEVNLSNNSLNTLQPRVFSGLVNLRVLRISANRLRHLTVDALRPLKKLRKLDLRRNLISVVRILKLFRFSLLWYHPEVTNDTIDSWVVFAILGEQMNVWRRGRVREATGEREVRSSPYKKVHFLSGRFKENSKIQKH